eukprot:TRINITY_DN4095_c0_g2_i1.p2 TRINITY_DN4095_c0_g2~~TRINITY_DN4095_c0_g2_i1.p2  ORF type:complete len:103 (+),score=20.02 TRINITY_DN4095_c0_g2_i1:38-346(+)
MLEIPAAQQIVVQLGLQTFQILEMLEKGIIQGQVLQVFLSSFFQACWEWVEALLIPIKTKAMKIEGILLEGKDLAKEDIIIIIVRTNQENSEQILSEALWKE